MEFRLTQKGREAKINPTTEGRILEMMQAGKGVVNPQEVNYELSLENSQKQLDDLVRGGYLSKEEEASESGLDVMGPDPYAGI